MNKPLVSVIIPAYNCANYIEKSIESALLQKVPLEIIVINDCSIENLDEVMLKYRDNPRIRYIHNEKNLGVAMTRNKAVQLAEGAYIAFLDSDDYWAEGKLEKQLDLMEKTGDVLCSTARELMTPEGECTGRIIPVKQRITYRELLKHNSINCSSVLVKTEVAKEFPMCHEDSHEDYIMWLQILKKYGKACAVNEPLLKYRVSDQGKSGSKLQSARMTFKVYRYLGFGMIQTVLCFCSYAFHGIKKHYLSKNRYFIFI